jgi:transcriptional regulator with XRE-family HTH domain
MQENNSQNANLILKKLKKTLKIATDIELSKILNVKPNTISSWKKRNTVDYNTIISICELYEIDLNEIFINTKAKNTIDFISCKTPLVSSELQFQYCIEKESLLESLPVYHFPFIKSSNTMVFQVSSNNMYPLIKLNSYVVCEAKDLNEIKDNSLAVIISRTKGFFMNRILMNKTNNNTLILNNENTFFSNIEFEKSDINEIWLVKGVLSYELAENSNSNKDKTTVSTKTGK